MIASAFSVKSKEKSVNLEKNSMTFTVGKYLFKGNHKDTRTTIALF